MFKKLINWNSSKIFPFLQRLILVSIHCNVASTTDNNVYSTCHNLEWLMVLKLQAKRKLSQRIYMASTRRTERLYLNLFCHKKFTLIDVLAPSTMFLVKAKRKVIYLTIQTLFHQVLIIGEIDHQLLRMLVCWVDQSQNLRQARKYKQTLPNNTLVNLSKKLISRWTIRAKMRQILFNYPKALLFEVSSLKFKRA